MALIVEDKSQQNKVLVGITGFAACLLVLTLDYLSQGHIHSLEFFYIIPVIAGAWFGGLLFGGVFALVGLLFSSAIKIIVAARAPNMIFYLDLLVQGVLYVALILTSTYLKQKMDSWKMMALTDPLTGVWGLRHFYDLTEREISRAKRYKRPFTFVYLDLDDFRKFNSMFEKEAGDDLLRSTAKAIIKKVRCIDVVARIGADEFGIVMPETSRENAVIAVRRLKNDIMESFQKHRWAITVSICSLTFVSSPENPDEILKKIQALMNDAKKKGKNVTIDSVN